MAFFTEADFTDQMTFHAAMGGYAFLMFTKLSETITRVRDVNHVAVQSGLPVIPDAVIETLIERDTLGLLNLS